jgi:hypothetical protein
MISLYRPGSPGGEMECPTCGYNTTDEWQRLIVQSGFHPGVKTEYQLEAPQQLVELDWMRCRKEGCGELVIRVHEGHSLAAETERGIERFFQQTDTYFARPRFVIRHLAEEVAEPFRTDYLEAGAILDLSPRMSAVLSRRILADLLEQCLKLDDFNLSDRVDKFRADTKHPSDLRENIHHFREIANFGAHTMKNDQDQIIPVDRSGAEWMLGFLDRLFDYLIVGPAKDQKMREAWDANLADAGRKSIPPLPENGS